MQSKNTKWSSTAITSFFCQDITGLDDDLSILQSVWQPGVVDEHFARTILKNFDLDSKMIHQKIKTLSPGEKAKTSLAKTVLSGANTLVLDEPTNHLEVKAREILEQALLKYQGSLIFVSHDTRFIKNVSTRVFDLESKKMYESYLEWEDDKRT